MSRHAGIRLAAACLALALTPVGVASQDAADVAAAQRDPGSATGRLRGVVQWRGRAPLRVKTLTNTVDVEACGSRVRSQAVLSSGDRGVANVVVELRRRDGEAASSSLEPIDGRSLEVSLQGCASTPHVSVVPAGSHVDIANPDHLAHALSTRASTNPPWTSELPRFQRRVRIPPRHLSRPEPVKLTCDRHVFMSAWLWVTRNEHVALSDEEGHFDLGRVPAGAWRLNAWHEQLGEVAADIVVTDGSDSEVTLELR